VHRIEVSEVGQPALPAVDLAGDFSVGSDPSATIRLPASAARGEHVRIEAARWRAIGDVRVAGEVSAGGELGEGVTLELGNYRVRIAPAPSDAVAATPQRTASLARELVRGLLGSDGAPTLDVERGPLVGARRALAAPPSTLVIGRGDEAGWVIVDDDLSRTHAEIRRGWDGVRVVDLGSKNGTKVDGVRVTDAELHDGALLELGNFALRFRDPAERHLRGDAKPPEVAVAAPGIPEVAQRARSSVVFYVALAILALALAGLAAVVGS
jgi:FHA domain